MKPLKRYISGGPSHGFKKSIAVHERTAARAYYRLSAGIKLTVINKKKLIHLNEQK